MAMSVVVEDAAAPAVGARTARRGRPARRVVTCGGVPGVLVRGEHGWALDNEAEVRMLAAMGGGGDRALDRFGAIAATLNAGLADPSGVRLVNGRLSAISSAGDVEMACRVRVPDDVAPAVVFACAHTADEMCRGWLVWMLSARLDDNLRREVLVGPGLASFQWLNDRYYRGFDRDVRWTVAMPPSFWDALESHPSRLVRDAAAASDPRTGPKALKRLAGSDDDTVRDLVASHPNTPARALVGLSEAPGVDHLVRWRAAQNDSASAWTLRRLAKHDFWQVRFVAAFHPNTDASALAALGADETEQVRSAAGRHPDTPLSVLVKLAGDGDKSVRAAVAANPSAPLGLIERLLADRISSVRRAAVGNPAAPVEMIIPLARDRAQGVRCAVAADPRLPGDVFETLARDPKAPVRRTVCGNPNAPAVVLRALTADPDYFVRLWVADNPGMPPDVLRVLAADPDKRIRAGVACNPSTPAETLKALAGESSEWIRSSLAANPSTQAETLRALAASDEYWIRANAAANPAAPAGLLEALACDGEGWVRAAVAENPSTPAATLPALAADADYTVRYEAAAALGKHRQETQSNREQKGGQ